MDHRLIATAVGVASFTAGAFAGYKFAYKRLGEEFERRLDEETRGMKEFYTNIPVQKYATPAEAVNDLVAPAVAAEALSEYKGEKVPYHTIVKSEVQPDPDKIVERVGEVVEETVRNVFDQRRDPTVPYILTQMEFMTAEAGYPQTTLTYYEKDEKLCDEHDEPLESVDATVGLDFKVNFGYESEDENTVYVRNERLGLDYEIVRHEGSYQKEVLGEDDTIIDPPVERVSARMRREQAEKQGR